MEDVRFSLCMIVKNEEAVLKDCLDSLQALIIIVDTGSTDRTKEIAAQYTDKIYDFQWCNDFSAARNFAFSKATGDYIYSADADEYIDAENRKKFQLLKQAILPEVEIVQMIYVTEQINHPTENFARDLRPKLFKRLRQFTWIEPIHETINTNPVDQVVRVLLHRKRITQRDRIDFQECTVFQEIVANLLFALDVVELAVSVFQNIQVALSLDAVIHIDRIIHVEIDPATQVDT